MNNQVMSFSRKRIDLRTPNLHQIFRICIKNNKNDADFSFMMQKNINFATTNKIRYAYI